MRRCTLISIDGLVQNCGISSALAMEIPQFRTKPDGLVQNCGISSALAMEIPQFRTKPSIYCTIFSNHYHRYVLVYTPDTIFPISNMI